ncbi:pilus assembly protein TadG-related protein [Neoactinobaculum massilliense]|uniref:pilus assembly protein TadG-related protein n=1 Tax=Neoactinobaculum massilliense TaxID=2364794 RepID=UPI000F52A632|nr:pilus assembly protein TadG-related protein [Neoactinobaculum massilliense]
MTRRAHAATHPASERGNITVFGLGVWLIAVAMLLGMIMLGTVYLERRTLQAEADSVALAVAQQVDDAAYYGGGALAPSSAAVGELSRTLATHAVVAPVGVENGSVVVSLRGNARVPFLHVDVPVRVTSRAHLDVR